MFWGSFEWHVQKSGKALCKAPSIVAHRYVSVKPSTLNFIKIRLSVHDYLHADRMTNTVKLIGGNPEPAVYGYVRRDPWRASSYAKYWSLTNYIVRKTVIFVLTLTMAALVTGRRTHCIINFPNLGSPNKCNQLPHFTVNRHKTMPSCLLNTVTIVRVGRTGIHGSIPNKAKLIPDLRHPASIQRVPGVFPPGEIYQGVRLNK